MQPDTTTKWEMLMKTLHFGMFGYQEHQKQIRGVKQIAFEFRREIFQDDIKEHLLLPLNHLFHVVWSLGAHLSITLQPKRSKIPTITKITWKKMEETTEDIHTQATQTYSYLLFISTIMLKRNLQLELKLKLNCNWHQKQNWKHVSLELLFKRE